MAHHLTCYLRPTRNVRSYLKNPDRASLVPASPTLLVRSCSGLEILRWLARAAKHNSGNSIRGDSRVQPHLVYGENIAQTLHFVVSGNASLGLIGRAQSMDERMPDAACYWSVPDSMHQPLEQQAILLSRASDNDVATDFLGYLRSATARELIAAHGYEVPD